MIDRLYKVWDVVPHAGRYMCIVCGLIMEYNEHHINNNWVEFTACPVCHAGIKGGPKQPHEDFWKEVD